MKVCTCSPRKCTCGAVDEHGVLRDGYALRTNVMLKDSAIPTTERKALTMMSDAEIKTMRDSVRGMPLHQAIKLPIYDNVRGSSIAGMSAEAYYATMDGAKSLPHLGSLPPTESNINDAGDKLAHQQAYERRISDAWKG